MDSTLALSFLVGPCSFLPVTIKDNYKSLVELEFLQDSTTDSRVSCH